MSIKITTLIEDSLDDSISSKSCDLICEHGLSFLIEKDNQRYLFDTGQTGDFIKNASKLDIKLDSIDKVILSHGHYDHTGGLIKFLDSYGSNVELIVNEEMFIKKFKKQDGKFKFIGNNFNKEMIKNKVSKIKFIENNVLKLDKSVYVTSNYKILNDIEKPNAKFYKKVNDRFVKDNFFEEVSVVIESEKGLIVLVGCSHIGIINILMNIKKVFNKEIYALLGGIHLVDADDEKINDTISWLKSENINHMYLSHCTGVKAENKIENSGCHTGNVLIFD